MYMVLSDVTNIPYGPNNVADVACILSPLYPPPTVPAIVDIIPVGDTTPKLRFLYKSLKQEYI